MQLTKRIEQLEAVSIKPDTGVILIRIVGFEKETRKLTGIQSVPFAIDEGETEESFIERVKVWITENNKGPFIAMSIFEDDILLCRDSS